jgi:hypothetical protein
MTGLGATAAAPSVLVVLNHRPGGPRPTVSETLDSLVTEGMLGGCDVYHFPARCDAGLGDAAIGAEILAAARKTGAALVLFAHSGTLAIDRATLRALRALPSAPALVYLEGDGYHPWYYPAPTATVRVMRACDVVFLPSGGPFLRVLRRAGCRDVRYAPSTASGIRFPHVWRAGDTHEWDVVLVGRRTTSRVPGRTFPGAHRRIALAHALQRRYGRRFGLFGPGWTGPSALGPLPFDEQADAGRRSVVVVGQNNSTWPLGFSNRLPISLATGTPTVYSRAAGFHSVFGTERDDWFFSSIEEALCKIDALLETGPAELDRRSAEGRAFFESDLERLVVLRHVVRAGLAARRGGGSAVHAQPPGAYPSAPGVAQPPQPPPGGPRASVPLWQLLPPA